MPAQSALFQHVGVRVAEARVASRANNFPVAWELLEDAHVLSQPLAFAHVRVHVAMLGVGVRTRDRREILGQMLRLIVAAPGSWSGKYPTGNTGRAEMPATRPMPIRADLQAILDPPVTTRR